jgi:NADPH-dependent curcumin reductase CurA
LILGETGTGKELIARIHKQSNRSARALENAPEAFIRMLDGRNFGKALVRMTNSHTH